MLSSLLGRAQRRSPRTREPFLRSPSRNLRWIWLGRRRGRSNRREKALGERTSVYQRVFRISRKLSHVVGRLLAGALIVINIAHAQTQYCEAPPPAGSTAHNVYVNSGNASSGCYGQYGGVTIVLDGTPLSGGLCTLTYHCSNGTYLNSKATYTPTSGCPYFNASTGTCVPNAPTNLASSPPNPSVCTGVGNPIYPLTGAKRDLVRTGIAIAGVPLNLTYDTSIKLPANQADASPMAEPNAFGALWRSSLHHKLQVNSGLTSAMLSRGDGYVVNFTGPGDGTFTALGGQSNKLASITGGYRFTDVSTGELETFDSAGVLQTIALANGRTLTFTYSGGNLVLVQSDEGRTVNFVYTNNLITSIYGTEAERISVSYDANANLSSLTWADGKTFGLLYENPSFTWALTGKTDENNQRLATYAYDDSGRAISTAYAGDVDKYSVTYGAAPSRVISDTYDVAANINRHTQSWIAPSGTSVTYPNGQVADWEGQVVDSRIVLTSKSQPAGSGCTAATSGITYDTAGNVTSRDGFDGTRICYAYDTSNRETTRVEGLSTSTTCGSVLPTGSALPSGARKITTTWHPDWQLPVAVTEAERKTTTVYQGQPDPFNNNSAISCTSAANRADGKPLPLVCKRVEQALLANGSLDASVPARTTTYTYDGSGRVSTITDPKSNATTQAYFSSTSLTGNGDKNIANVKLLVHFEGANGSTAFADSSFVANAITPHGAAQISNSQVRFGTSAGSFNGTNAWLRTQQSADFQVFGGDFTVEWWAYFSAATANQVMLHLDGGSTNRASVGLSSGTIVFYAYAAGSSGTRISATAPSLNAWHHIALTRAGTSITLWVDGTSVGTSTTTLLPTGNLYCSIGSDANVGGSSYFSGFIDDLRITKGVARYTAAFTPPPQQLPDTGPDMNALGQTTGDLQSVTNAAGQVTQYTLYDPAGHVRQMVDPKGITTDITYTPRGMVSTVTVTPAGGAARTTSYGYDSAGQLISVNLPDGTSLGYGYDAAHRLTSVTDAQGNTVTYTLDAAGNRAGEDVRDSSGTLQRSIARSFDALNRVQQVTGAAR